MAELDTYSSLTGAIASWGKRTYTTSQLDQFIRVAEADANMRLGQSFRVGTETTVTTNSEGVAALPSGFIGMVSIVRDVLGSVPLKQVSWDALTSRNPYATAGDPEVYAIKGSLLKVAPVVEDDFIAQFSSTLSGLTATNTTNWLLSLAPNYYLFACRAAAYAYHEQFDLAAPLEAKASDILEKVISQAQVAALGNAEMTFDGVMP